jgi:hypothetical protein
MIPLTQGAGVSAFSFFDWNFQDIGWRKEHRVKDFTLKQPWHLYMGVCL